MTLCTLRIDKMYISSTYTYIYYYGVSIVGLVRATVDVFDLMLNAYLRFTGMAWL